MSWRSFSQMHQWSDTFSHDSGAREELLRKADAVRSREKKKIGNNFFSAANESADNSTVKQQDRGVEPSTSHASPAQTAIVSDCIMNFSEHLSVPVNEFFTEEVLGQERQ